MKKLLSLFLFLFVVSYVSLSHAGSAYDRVIKTGEINCGYWVWSPLITQDPNNPKNLSGIFKDYMEEVARLLNLKVNWTTNIGYSELEASLEADKFDVMCGGVWAFANRARAMEFGNPIYYTPVDAFVRNDDDRFDADLAKLNSPDVTFATMDGLVVNNVIALEYPKANVNSIPDLSSVSEIFENVKGGKADVMLHDVFTSQTYIENNPNVVRKINKEPIRYYPNVLAVRKGEFELLTLLNAATDELIRSGVIDQILKKYENIEGSLLRIAPPYKQPNSN